MNSTEHKLLTCNSNNIKDVESESVELIITSPPYPMIEMWDEIFASQNPKIKEYILNGNGVSAYYAMHNILNSVWDECDRVLKSNCFICINIGDATRTINGDFNLYPNHSAIIDYFFSQGYSVLPDIHWRKHSNSPNKYMGSGMYPAGAYVTYEHEYILVFRKGGKRIFDDASKNIRRESAYFWEERNNWFSDLWEIKGASQSLRGGNERTRNASFPLDIPYRLVNMYSVKNDIVLDPFNGLGTTTLACMASQRNSIGVDISNEITTLAVENIKKEAASLNQIIDGRLSAHRKFIDNLDDVKKSKCYLNKKHNILVKTMQEKEIEINYISDISNGDNHFRCDYQDLKDYTEAHMVAEGQLALNLNG